MEAPSAELLQIPGSLRHRHRASRECDGDVRAECQPFGCLRGKSDGKERVMPCLEGPGSVKPHSLVASRLVGDGGKASVAELRVELHRTSWVRVRASRTAPCPQTRFEDFGRPGRL